MTHKTHIFPYLLAGGLGERLSPLSTEEKPKQFLPLISGQSMIDETLGRLEGAGYEPASIITNIAHKDIMAPYENVIFETERKGTAFAIQTAAHDALKKDEHAKILILPCDHYIEDPQKLYDAITLAAGQPLSVFGVKPDTPETGYGYIQEGRQISAEVYEVCAFKEKPDQKTAETYVKEGSYFWNAGIFLFDAKAILDEINLYAPDLEKQKTSIDYAVLEKSDRLHMVQLKTYWRDLGSINALDEVKAKISA